MQVSERASQSPAMINLLGVEVFSPKQYARSVEDPVGVNHLFERVFLCAHQKSPLRVALLCAVTRCFKARVEARRMLYDVALADMTAANSDGACRRPGR